MDSYLIDDKPCSTIPYIAELLDAGIRVLMYSGDRDMACNFMGTEELLSKMEWYGHHHCYSTPRGLWVVNGESAGYSKSHENLDIVVMYNSGHLAPYKNPINALDLITRFHSKQSFNDYGLPNFGDYVAKKSSGDSIPIMGSANSLADPNSPPVESTQTTSSGTVLPLFAAFVAGLAVAYISQRRYAGYQRL